MCGIVGYIGTQSSVEILLGGLEKLEYRGYDSAGVATLLENNLNCIKAKGKLFKLKEKVDKAGSQIHSGKIGIGHTRWATHGKAEENNAHPHLDNKCRIAVVQNGIVENHLVLRDELQAKGYQFLSETDTEVIPHLISDFLASSPDGEDALLIAIQKTLSRLEGAYALAIISADYPDQLIIARQQAPITIGFGQGEFFCASDVTALVSHTKTVLSLENGELAILNPLGVQVYDFHGQRLKKTPRVLDWNHVTVEKNGFRHFMLKEIHEQPNVIRSCLDAYLHDDWNLSASPEISPINLGLPSELLEGLDQIQILACGTSWHASLIGKYLIEQLAGIPTAVQYSSEFRYAPSPVMPNTLTIGVTQSGETADTIAALETEKNRRAILPSQYHARLLGITNRPESTLAHMVDQIINTQAGIEVGVAATKSFVAQLIGFYLLAIDLAYIRKTLSLETIKGYLDGLRQLPTQMELILDKQSTAIEELAHDFSSTQDFIFIGRGINFPIALEGALKLKEISYIHAEGYPAGELKHGPIALLDEKVPVVAIAVPGSVYEKVMSNAQEAKARDSRLLGVVNFEDQEATRLFSDLLYVPKVDEILSPVLTVIPLQLLSYHIAARRGLDVDQPRNLAKSVTVE